MNYLSDAIGWGALGCLVAWAVGVLLFVAVAAVVVGFVVFLFHKEE